MGLGENTFKVFKQGQHSKRILSLSRMKIIFGQEVQVRKRCVPIVLTSFLGSAHAFYGRKLWLYGYRKQRTFLTHSNLTSSSRG
ncbi:hypothetical protein NE237_014209 [Protea cynaroides]|uniref:Uncharacterized protein n=1 Tax=Protea cynaroides TaxID=273540 RepID=A0A9Q0GNF8_9MAGN|nr:hypothetical protein NE237_014209 [Protea cynaroides]